MKNYLFVLVFVMGLFASCETRKVETVYDSLSGEWYLYAAYLNGADTDVLPTVKLFYPCIGSSMATFRIDKTFNMDSECEGGKTHGTYIIKGDSVLALDTANIQQILIFSEGSLSQKREIPVLGSAELRFQKTTP